MNSNATSLGDFMKVYRIRKKNDETEKPQNKNYEEFRQVYRGVINKPVGHSLSTTSERYVEESKSGFSQRYVKGIASSQSEKKTSCSDRKGGRPVKEIKTVRIEWPVLGNEGAICQPVYRNRLPIKRNVKPQVQPQPKKTPTLTEQIIENWNRIEVKLTEVEVRNQKSKATFSTGRSSSSMERGDKRTSTPRLPERSRRRPQSPTFKLKGKHNRRHHDCINRKYMATLTSIKQKLQKLDEKYFNRPQVSYKSVRDIFTQPSKGEVSKPERQNSDEVKIEEVFRGIKMDLDEIANPKLETAPAYSSTDWPFRKRTSSGELNRNTIPSYSKIIDETEARFNRMRIIKQHVVDVEEFCDKLCNIGEEDDDREQPQTSKMPDNEPEKNSVFTDIDNDDKGIFDDTELQKSVARSAYLMREFKIDPSMPTVKIFSDNSSSFFRNTSQFLEAGGSSSKKRDSSITSLIDHLNAALNNSIYKPV